MTGRNIFIGFGGTGAKIAEILVHLCAAGLGPDSIILGLGDQDASGGNTGAANRTLADYRKVRDALWSSGSPDAIPAEHEAERLFRTRLKPLCAPEDVRAGDALSKNIWVPQAAAGAKLSDLSARGPAPDVDRAILDLLYEDGPDEAHMPLTVGFQGKPHVGAAAVLLDADTSEFWQELKRYLQESNQIETRIFLAGSAFGGTGASLFPTLARRIRKEIEGASSGVRVAGALMVPYFSFPSSTKEEDQHAAKASEFFSQTKRSLRFYAQSLAQHDLFDDLYVLGWQPLIDLGYFSKGAGSQKNPPLAPELFAALAALREFAKAPRPAGATGHAGRVNMTALGSSDTLSWSDLPSISDAVADKVDAGSPDAAVERRRLAQWLRFAYAWRNRFSPNFRKRRFFSRDQWFQNHLRDANLNDSQAEKAIGEFVDASLEFFASMGVWTEKNGGTRFRLWNPHCIAHAEAEVADSRPLDVRLRDSAELNQKNHEAFDQLILQREGDDPLPSIHHVEMALAERKSKTANLGAFAAALYGATDPQLKIG